MGYGRKERGRQGRREEDIENVEYTQDQYLGTATNLLLSLKLCHYRVMFSNDFLSHMI